MSPLGAGGVRLHTFGTEFFHFLQTNLFKGIVFCHNEFLLSSFFFRSICKDERRKKG
jgi:hypothetical protein